MLTKALAVVSLLLAASLPARAADESLFAVEGRPYTVTVSSGRTIVQVAVIVPHTNRPALIGPVDCTGRKHCSPEDLLGSCPKTSITTPTSATWSCVDSHQAQCWSFAGYLDGLGEARLIATMLSPGQGCLY